MQISIEECVRKDSKPLTFTFTLQEALKEKVLNEEENLQDYQMRRALHGEFVQ